MTIVSPLGTGESLVVGDEGEQVGELQRRLRHLGYYGGNVDQRYGDTTESAMREFQRASGRPDDGHVDVETWETLDREAQFAGYDPYAQPDGAVQDQSAEPGHVSDDGMWQWDGTEWRAVDCYAYGQTAEATPVERHGGPMENERSATASETSSVDPNAFPDVQEGDSGEWVKYLDAMLTSTGF